MTACAIEGVRDATDVTESAATARPHRPAPLTITADGSYAARLTRAPGSDDWFPERWTLDGCEPYAVPLPGRNPEAPDSALLPLTDGRVLINRRAEGRWQASLLYPTGPGTGELPLGSVESEELTLLPPCPAGTRAYALAATEHATAIWLLHGAGGGPQRVTQVPGRCSGGAWLDRQGRLLALDRELEGITKTVVVDLARNCEVTPLLQITEESDDRLLLADPDSGLVLLRSDAPGRDRLGWGVLGSTLPVRFPECLRAADAALTPFAVQPGQMLTPENCAVAFRVDAAAGTWLAVWRPALRTLRQLPAPRGWQAGTGRWTVDGGLRLPYATPSTPCGVARMAVPWDAAPDAPGQGAAPAAALPVPVPVAASQSQRVARFTWDTSAALSPTSGIVNSPREQAPGCTRSAQSDPVAREPYTSPKHPQPCRPVPLQQAPLAAREAREAR